MMTDPVLFALNHMAAPAKSHAELFDLAVALCLGAVEIRNDLNGVAIADGTSAAVVRADAASRGLKILSINALQRFNDWTPERAEQARYLVDYAKESGAEALVLCPVNDLAWQPTTAERLAHLRQALEGLAPILSDAGILGFIEPLGFSECSLRSKREAVEAIDHLGGGAPFRIVHDTFHHHLAGEPALFPQHTGLVHISGVPDPGLAVTAMRDPHRVLVGPDDRIGNIAQMRALIDAFYRGPFSFEPFAAEVRQRADIEAALRASMDFITTELRAAAA